MSLDPFLSACEVADSIRRRAVSPTEVMTACLDRIARLEPELNAFCHVADEEARRTALALTDELCARRGPERPFLGVPIAIKDQRAVRGWPLCEASNGTAHDVMADDAPAVRALREAGFVFVGATTSPSSARRRSPSPGATALRGTRGIRAKPGRVERRVRRDRGGRHPADRPWLGWRRLDPRAGELLRTRRAQAQQGARARGSARPRGLRQRRGAHAHRRGQRSGAGRLCDRAAPQLVRGAPARAPLSQDGCRRSASPERRPQPATRLSHVRRPHRRAGCPKAAELLAGLGHEIRETSIPGLDPEWFRDAFDVVYMTGSAGSAVTAEDRLEPLNRLMRRRARETDSLTYVETVHALQRRSAEMLEAWDEVDLVLTPTNPIPIFGTGSSGRARTRTGCCRCGARSRRQPSPSSRMSWACRRSRCPCSRSPTECRSECSWSGDRGTTRRCSPSRASSSANFPWRDRRPGICA